MPIYKYEADTPASEIVQKFAELLPDDGICQRQEVLDFHAPTVLAGGTAMDMARAITSEYWAYWDLKALGKDTSPIVRKVLINKIDDPARALRLYLDCDWLTDEEDALLKAKFEGKLPTAEKELEDGEITRAKGAEIA